MDVTTERFLQIYTRDGDFYLLETPKSISLLTDICKVEPKAKIVFISRKTYETVGRTLNLQTYLRKLSTTSSK